MELVPGELFFLTFRECQENPCGLKFDKKFHYAQFSGGVIQTACGCVIRDLTEPDEFFPRAPALSVCGKCVRDASRFFRERFSGVRPKWFVVQKLARQKVDDGLGDGMADRLSPPTKKPKGSLF